MNKLTGSQTPHNVSTMRVMSRRFIDAYNSLCESERYLPGLEHWLGYEVSYVPTIHVERAVGRSSYSFRKRLGMAVNSILSFSDRPLRIVATFGFAMAALGILATLVIIFMKLFLIDFQAGYASIMTAIVLCSGFIISSIGLGSLYIGKILREVQRRPVFLTKELIKIQ
jgi:dolichol-phosphate mannosyltransferase